MEYFYHNFIQSYCDAHKADGIVNNTETCKHIMYIMSKIYEYSQLLMDPTDSISDKLMTEVISPNYTEEQILNTVGICI